MNHRRFTIGIINANTEFTKTWRFTNIGTNDWIGYMFNYVSGDICSNEKEKI